MAITFDAASSAGWGAPASSISWNHTVGAGSNRALYVGVAIRGTNEQDETVTGITYNGVALTKVLDDGVSPLDNVRCELWRLVNPATGTNQVAVTLGGTTDSGQNAMAVSLFGVHQASPEGATAASGPNTGTSVTTNLTTQHDNSWIIDAVSHRNDTDILEGASQTNRVESNDGGNNICAMSTKTTTTAGATSMSWSQGADNRWRHVVAEVREATGGGPNTAAIWRAHNHRRRVG